MLVMMNSSHCRWSSPLRLSPSSPPWVPGGVEFRVDGKELQLLFEVQCGILGPRQSLYIEGGRFMDARGDLKVVREIAM